MRPRIWYAVAAMVVSLLSVVGANVVYTQHVQRQAAAEQDDARRESEQKWCAVIGTLDDAYSSRPATTPLGRQIAAAMAQLRRDLGC